MRLRGTETCLNVCMSSLSTHLRSWVVAETPACLNLGVVQNLSYDQHHSFKSLCVYVQLVALHGVWPHRL